MKLALMLLIYLFLNEQTFAKTLYVNISTGNDSTTYLDNSSARPWRTIGREAWGGSVRLTPNSAQAAQAVAQDFGPIFFYLLVK